MKKQPKPKPAKPAEDPEALARELLATAMKDRAPRSMPALISLSRDLHELHTAAVLGDVDAVLAAAGRLRGMEKACAEARLAVHQIRIAASAARDAAARADSKENI